MARSRRQAVRHGYIVIDKPAGWTSHDVIARVRKIVSERRVGHAGTLDPMATGVLPIAVGLATRTVEYLAVSDKAYRAAITFGIATDSGDADGDVIATRNANHLTLLDLEPILKAFTGEIDQVPPMHSAIKVNGQRLYALARKGESIEIAPRHVEITELGVVAWSPPVLTVDVTCSKGTYIRALARDIGANAGVGAHLSALRRTRSGPFTFAQAMTLETLEQRILAEPWQQIAFPADITLRDKPRIDLADADAIDWSQGKRIQLQVSASTGSVVSAYDADGTWRGVGTVGPDGDIHPTKVIHTE